MFAKLSSLFGILLFTTSLFPQSKPEDIIGHYMSPDKNSIFRFYKEGDKYFGKAVWMKRPTRLDTLNPDVNKRTQKILGSLLVWDFVYDGKDTWTKGYLYDANKGKIYKSKITRDKNGNITVRGYIGISLLGKTEHFVRVDFKE